LALSRERKEELVAEYVSLLGRSKGIIFTEYRGLSNAELSKLRRSVRQANGVYHVIKTTLLKLAMEQAGYPPLPDDLLGRPIALGFCLDEVPAVAKAITDYAKDSELLAVRGGLIGEHFVSGEQVTAIAELPPLEVLQAQLLGLLEAPASQLVGVLQAGVAQVVNVIHAYVEQGEGVAA